ncbi:unnamed protein product [Blumeria hordei]|uniref:Uncharacterized protein n=1 Tax=Blumeria hordei TaxID=2867405 RepID=A0A383UVH2_BLUHO|nr:unnamed protein product [Blumeria hordei]
MVYDWENKEEVCYRMYIEEKKSLEDIMEFMKVHYKFNPSKRAFQTQFKKWDFPSKQHPAHKNLALVQRVKELWDCNTSQRDMLHTLNKEGFEIKERELMRVRAKNRWLLRVPNSIKSKKKTSDHDVISQLQQALYPDRPITDGAADNGALNEISIQAPLEYPNETVSPPLSPEVIKKRQERLSKLQAESAERWAMRKRRRRTRGWAGLPADPPGPPRFPSETTIDESKAFLNLDNTLYRDIRSHFQRICEDSNITKKTIAGPERWEAAKDRLIQESPHLRNLFWINDENQDVKKLALDVVCSDVTKRMRTLERRMTIAEAKNTLSVNPEQSRQLRNSFYQVLKADHFTSKLEAGEQHWKDLKSQWVKGSELLQSILAPGDSDPNHQEKIKAMEVLCRDVMKRLRDDQTKRDPTRRKSVYFPSSTKINICDAAAPPDFHLLPNNSVVKSVLQEQTNQAQLNISDSSNFSRVGLSFIHDQLQSQQPVIRGPELPDQSHDQRISENNNLQIDPSLLLAVENDNCLINQNLSEQILDPQHAECYINQTDKSTLSYSFPFTAYFRAHPGSEVQTSSSVWISTVTKLSVEELRQAASAKFPGTFVLRIEGVIKQISDPMLEVMFPIDQNEELGRYLEAIQGMKPIFSVQLIFNTWKAND